MNMDPRSNFYVVFICLSNTSQADAVDPIQVITFHGSNGRASGGMAMVGWSVARDEADTLARAEVVQDIVCKRHAGSSLFFIAYRNLHP